MGILPSSEGGTFVHVQCTYSCNIILSLIGSCVFDHFPPSFSLFLSQTVLSLRRTAPPGCHPRTALSRLSSALARSRKVEVSGIAQSQRRRKLIDIVPPRVSQMWAGLCRRQSTDQGSPVSRCDGPTRCGWPPGRGRAPAVAAAAG